MKKATEMTKENIRRSMDALFEVRKRKKMIAADILQPSIEHEKKLRDDINKGLERYDELPAPFQYIVLLLKGKEIEKKTCEADVHNTEYWKLKKQQDELLRWFGPYEKEMGNNIQECCVCKRERSRLICAAKEEKWEKYICMDCVVEHNLYCVMCGEIETSGLVGISTESGNYICPTCAVERQGREADAGSFVGKCDRCGQTNVSLWLEGKELFCNSCKAYV